MFNNRFCVITLATILNVASACAVDPDDLRNGLVATYSAGGQKISRVEPSAALYLKPGESPDPRLPATESRVEWKGYVNLLRAGEYRFIAALCGKVSVKIGDKVLLNGESLGKTTMIPGVPTTLAAGVWPITVEYDRPAGESRLELIWTGPAFRTEPLNPEMLGHIPDKPDASRVVEHGRFLAEEMGCANCHKPAAGQEKALATRMGPNLARIGERAYAGWLERWLADPSHLRSATKMPALFDDSADSKAEIQAITAYLTTLGGPAKPPEPTKNIKEFTTSINRGKALFYSTGCAACHENGLENAKPVESPTLYGLLGTHGAQFQYPLGAVGAKTSPESLAKFLANPLANNPSGRMPSLNLSGQESMDLARYLCAITDAKIPREGSALKKAPSAELLEKAKVEAGKLKPEQQWAALGKALIVNKGCVNCHSFDPKEKTLSPVLFGPSLADLAQGADKGCLADKPSRVKYTLSEADRRALRAFAAEAGRHVTPSPVQAARVSFKRFGCLNCHNRDGEGGIGASLADRMRQYEKIENAEALLPPTLSGVGHKLRTPWLKQVLTGGGRSRPWMALRMPQYGEANVGFLAEQLAALEGAIPDDTVHSVALSPAKIGTGRQLIGKGGFSCTSCHDIAGVANSGTRGPDLSTTNQRVRYEWYRRWMEQPQRMVPGTKMPQVFPNGKSTLDHILGGNADDQSEAMWAYLSLGPSLPLPEGLEPPKGLVVAVSEKPAILRTFIPDASPRAIAVGYPGGVNVVFDGINGRLAYAWVGNFLDVSPVWNNRGGQMAKLLGTKFWTAPAGTPWALGTDVPDFTAIAKDPAYGANPGDGQVYLGLMKYLHEGYTLDPVGYPTFRYRVGEKEMLRVEETPRRARSSAANGLTRQFRLEIPAGQTAWLHVADAANLRVSDGAAPNPLPAGELSPNGKLLLLPSGGGSLALRLSTDAEGIRWLSKPHSDMKVGLYVRVPAAAQAQPVSLELHIWQLPREDAEFLKVLLAEK